MYGDSTCKEMGSMVCGGELSGTAKASFCNAKGTFCSLVVANTMRSCKTDADCTSWVPCCSWLKKIYTDACDGVDTAALDKAIKETKADGQCADTACSAGPATRAGARYLHHQRALTHVLMCNIDAIC